MLRRSLFLAFFLSLPPPDPEGDAFPPPPDGLRQALFFLVSLIFVPSTVYASDGTTINSGQQVEINMCGVCYLVYNGYGGAPSEYVPTTSCGEWQSFYSGGALQNQGFSGCPSPPPCCYSPPSGSDGGGSDGGGGDGGGDG